MKKISRFEFAILEAADPENAKKYIAKTKEEELEERIANIRRQASQIRIKKQS